LSWLLETASDLVVAVAIIVYSQDHFKSAPLIRTQLYLAFSRFKSENGVCYMTNVGPVVFHNDIRFFVHHSLSSTDRRVIKEKDPQVQLLKRDLSGRADLRPSTPDRKRQ
jgi:hypothetical protein